MPLQEEFPGITGLVNLGSKFVENTNLVLEGAGQIQSGKDSTQVNEEARPIGSKAVLNGKPVFWAGQNYGYQTKESYDKLMDEGQFRMGEITAQRIGNSINQAIPQEVKDFATKKITDAATAAEDFYNQQDYDTQQNIKTGLRFAYGAVTTIDKSLEFISEKTNTSRFITDELVTAAATGGASVALKRAAPIVKQAGKTTVKVIDTAIDDILTPPGGGLQLATAGVAPMGLAPSTSKGSISLRPQVMEAVTSTNQRVNTAVGVKPGDSMYDASGMQGKQLLRRDKNIDDYLKTISLKNNEIDALRELKGDPKNLQEFVNNSSPELQKYWETEKGNVNKIIDRLTDNKKNAQEGLSRAESNVLPFVSTKEAERIQDFKNVNYFRSTIGLSEKKAEQTARKIKGYLEQHHLFPKGMSAAFFGKMDELISKGVATKDDLILMAEFASVKGRRAGDIKANLLNMQQTPHNRMHTELRAMGAELSKSDYQRLLKDVDNVDDLLDKWADLFEPGIEGDAVYNAAVAELWEPMDDLIRSVSPKYTGEAKSNPALFN